MVDFTHVQKPKSWTLACNRLVVKKLSPICRTFGNMGLIFYYVLFTSMQYTVPTVQAVYTPIYTPFHPVTHTLMHAHTDYENS